MAISITFQNKPTTVDFDSISTGVWFTHADFPNVVFLKTYYVDSQENAIGFEDGCEFGEYYSFDGGDKISTEVKFTMHVGDAE